MVKAENIIREILELGGVLTFSRDELLVGFPDKFEHTHISLEQGYIPALRKALRYIKSRNS